MDTYFTKFPQIVYDNYTVTDITRRVRISEQTRNQLALYYQYTVKNGTRPDIIADAYYDDPYADWMLYLANQTVDPLSQWNKTEYDFEKSLAAKYGSSIEAIRRIAFYRNNWYDDYNNLSVDYYNNTLAPDLRRYYTAVYAPNGKITEYKRKPEDWVMNTNQIIKLSVANTELQPTDLFDVYNLSQSVVGTGEVVSRSDDFILVKNISGTFANNYTVQKKDSSANSTITDVQTVQVNIPADHAVFWSAVTYFDVENERNEYARQIQILDSSYMLDTSEQIRQKLNE